MFDEVRANQNQKTVSGPDCKSRRVNRGIAKRLISEILATLCVPFRLVGAMGYGSELTCILKKIRILV